MRPTVLAKTLILASWAGRENAENAVTLHRDATPTSCSESHAAPVTSSPSPCPASASDSLQSLLSCLLLYGGRRCSESWGKGRQNHHELCGWLSGMSSLLLLPSLLNRWFTVKSRPAPLPRSQSWGPALLQRLPPSQLLSGSPCLGMVLPSLSPGHT